MTIETKYDVGQVVPITVDMGSAKGTIERITATVNQDGETSVAYEGTARWTFKNQAHSRKFIEPEERLK